MDIRLDQWLCLFCLLRHPWGADSAWHIATTQYIQAQERKGMSVVGRRDTLGLGDPALFGYVKCQSLKFNNQEFPLIDGAFLFLSVAADLEAPQIPCPVSWLLRTCPVPLMKLTPVLTRTIRFTRHRSRLPSPPCMFFYCGKTYKKTPTPH